MPSQFMFSRARCLELIERLGKGEPIAPVEPGRWNPWDALQVAGAILAAAGSQSQRRLLDVRPVPEAQMVELYDRGLADALAIAAFAASLTIDVALESYAARFEPLLEGFCVADPSLPRPVPRRVVITSGLKSGPEA